MRLSEKYKNLNKDKHNSEPTWGCGDGRRYTQQINKILNNNCTVLDYGCGKGKLDIPKEYEVFRYDPCNPMYEKRPKNNYKYDDMIHIIYCDNVTIDEATLSNSRGDSIDVDISKNIIIFEILISKYYFRIFCVIVYRGKITLR